ncbi:MAG: exodeoxyribonuclease VII large subunit [Nitrosomonas sp.]|nr:exodeoxyribonuclease VII large subunit [Nitrosomonas sp.]MDP1952089.1 exodeoxyribonuclease VII large subunit [Nitrosomonas sp.]
MLLLPISNTSRPILSVSELNYSTKLLLEQAMPLLWVSGEISNLKCYNSGHWYFSLKDANAQVRCVMFRHKNRYVDWQPEDGMQVEVNALATLYEPRGDFQLSIEIIRRAGLGTLFEAFEQLKAKLDKAGLFDPAHKKTLPIYPKQIGIITSPSAAALRDVLSTLKYRMPALPVIIYPTPVQGEGAAVKIAEAIRLATERAECDVLILCRGGGGIEDLWAFNEEIVAQAIAASPIPIISGIGHETDFTIADFIADVRAPTPTGAAQLACQDARTALHQINALGNRMQQSMLHRLERWMQDTDILTHRLLHPGERIHNQLIQLQHLRERLINRWSHYIESNYWRLCETSQRLAATSPNASQLKQQQREIAKRMHRAMTHYTKTLEINLQHQQSYLLHLNPQAVLARGYSISYTAEGAILRSSDQIDVGDNIKVQFAKGWCKASVSKKNK